MKTLWHKAESCFQEHLEHLNLALISLKLSQTKHEKTYLTIHMGIKRLVCQNGYRWI